MQEKIIILDFGSQYTQLIARRLRELNTYCEILPYNKFPYGEEGIKGVILSGSPYSVNDPNALFVDLSRIRGVYPVLGVCYGAQFLAHTSGGKVESADTREYGRANLAWHDENDPLMRGVRENSTVWMSHGDSITVIPSTFTLVASTHEVKTAAFHIEGELTWGVQFHPEVYHSEDGTLLLTNFEIRLVFTRLRYPSIADPVSVEVPKSPLFLSEQFTPTDIMELATALQLSGAIRRIDGTTIYSTPAALCAAMHSSHHLSASVKSPVASCLSERLSVQWVDSTFMPVASTSRRNCWGGVP